VFLYASKELAPGQSAFGQLRLQDDVLVLAGDRFIVRQFSPVTTIGGGEVLDPLARRPTVRDTGRVAFLETLERDDKTEILSAMTERAVLGLTFEDMIARTGWLEDEIAAAAKNLIGTGRAKNISAEPLVLLAGRAFDEVRQKINSRVEKFHKENPLLPGISREDLRSSLGRRVRPEAFRAALDDLLAQKKLEAQVEIVKRAGSSINLDPEEARAKEQTEKAFAAAGLAVPAVKEVLSKLPVEAKRAEKILQILLREKTLVRVTPDLIFHRDALAQLRDRLSVFKKTKGERISVPVFKELTGITRKYAIPLLEYLDRERVTRRAGDERVIL
jgi:selenocysteine-specific elongation factor